MLIFSLNDSPSFFSWSVITYYHIDYSESSNMEFHIQRSFEHNFIHRYIRYGFLFNIRNQIIRNTSIEKEIWQNLQENSTRAVEQTELSLWCSCSSIKWALNGLPNQIIRQRINIRLTEGIGWLVVVIGWHFLYFLGVESTFSGCLKHLGGIHQSALYRFAG